LAFSLKGPDSVVRRVKECARTPGAREGDFGKRGFFANSTKQQREEKREKRKKKEKKVKRGCCKKNRLQYSRASREIETTNTEQVKSNRQLATKVIAIKKISVQ